jgi:hypothetical protein
VRWLDPTDHHQPDFQTLPGRVIPVVWVNAGRTAIEAGQDGRSPSATDGAVADGGRGGRRRVATVRGTR